MGNTAAEDERSSAWVLLPCTPEGLHPGFCLRGAGQRFGVEAPVPPGNVCIVDLVLYAEIVERNEPADLDPARDTGGKCDQVIEQSQDIGCISTVGCGCQAEEEV